VKGHLDGTGGKADKLRMPQACAGRAGPPGDRAHAADRGLGEIRPAASSDTDERRALNWRVPVSDRAASA
jgi:hypothetical protein